jgi:hypothetical protein
MRTRLLLYFILTLTISCFAQEDKYTKTMSKTMMMMDSARTNVDFVNLSNAFERIAKAEKSKWIPYYYAAECQIMASFLDSVNGKKDSYLDKADIYLTAADSLQPNDSEIYTLKGFAAQMRMVVNPMQRWQKYGELSNSLFEKAKELNPDNPRPDYLVGQALLYTPEAFGGGKKNALPVLKQSQEKYKKFKPETSISPNWGESILNNLLKTLEEDSTKTGTSK